MEPAQLTVKEVQRLASAGRVRPAPNYHAFQHLLRFEDCAFALRTCYRVEAARNPRGYVAFGHLSVTRQARIDFELGEDDEGRLILVVSGWQVEPRR